MAEKEAKIDDSDEEDSDDDDDDDDDEAVTRPSNKTAPVSAPDGEEEAKGANGDSAAMEDGLGLVDGGGDDDDGDAADDNSDNGPDDAASDATDDDDSDGDRLDALVSNSFYRLKLPN